MKTHCAIRIRPWLASVLFGLTCGGLFGQAGQRGLVDVHVHHNGNKKFLEQMLAKLDKYDGTAFILTLPKDLQDVEAFIKQHPKRFVGIGSIRLDDPEAVSLVDRLNAAG